MELHQSLREALLSEGINLTNEQIKDVLESIDGIPKTLIATNIPTQLFGCDSLKEEFEQMFKEIDPNTTFNYLKSFRRAKVLMTSSEAALLARVKLHKFRLGFGTRVVAPLDPTQSPTSDEASDQPVREQVISCYMAQEDVKPNSEGACHHLQPPIPDKQYLISPPSSPPVGWEPKLEAEPCINYDLLAALACLAPGEDHTLHAAEADKPCITITPCEDPIERKKSIGKPPIVQTRCPERKQ